MIVRAEVRLPFTTGIPRDVAINTLHYIVDDPSELDETVMDDLTTAVAALYNTQVDGSGDPAIEDGRIGGVISPIVSRAENACRVRFYDVTDLQSDGSGPPLVLAGEGQWTLTGDGSGELPLTNELAVCVTLTCTPATPVPIRRRRGRIYLGPLNASIIGSRSVGGIAYPAIKSATRDLIAYQMAAYLDLLTTPYNLAVYSRINEAAYQVSGGWIDNDLDIQRRRELDPSVRTNFGTLA